MGNRIYHIPLWDAFKKDSDCPICLLQKSLEVKYQNAILDTQSFMEEEFDEIFGHYTICSMHLDNLYKNFDKFGLALLMNKLLAREISHMEDIKNHEDNEKSSIRKNFVDRFIEIGAYKQKKDKDKDTASIKKPCFICKSVNEGTNMYIESLILLWRENDDFKDVYKNSKGFCQRHFYNIIDKSHNILEDEDLNEFIELNYALQKINIQALTDELKWFIKKFNYEFASEPWGRSKTALMRSITKLKP
ncbi:MAG: DUF6062 domain-containing protein [Xylanivirga thermophila]|uniref:DUF6062 family protein n=1 Tax=Xylanivirga thermophila TaxID=2496273 RepID=UPI0039F516C4